MEHFKKQTVKDIQSFLESIPAFESCADSFRARLKDQSQQLSLRKGQMLFVGGEKSDRFYLIQSGWIKLFRETLDGAQAVVDILTTGHIFGETSIFQDDIYPYSAEAAEPSEVLSLPLSLLKSEIETNPKLALSMLSSMARYRRQQDQEIEHRTLQNAPQRISCFLLRLASQDAQGPVTLHLPYDKTLIASRLGMQPETFSRALAKLKEATGIKIRGATVELETLNQLVEYSCAACSSEFPCKDLDIKKTGCCG
jgi:CRP-like cAMP-binding protein